MFHFFTRNWGKNNKKNFQCVEMGNDILIYINIKEVFFGSLIKSTDAFVNILPKCDDF